MAAILQTEFSNAFFFNQNVWFFFINIWSNYIPVGPIGNRSALVQMMAGRRTGNKPLSAPMMVKVADAYRCVTRPLWDKCPERTQILRSSSWCLFSSDKRCLAINRHINKYKARPEFCEDYLDITYFDKTFFYQVVSFGIAEEMSRISAHF